MLEYKKKWGQTANQIKYMSANKQQNLANILWVILTQPVIKSIRQPVANSF